jgi:hypothetical protein
MFASALHEPEQQLWHCVVQLALGATTLHCESHSPPHVALQEARQSAVLFAPTHLASQVPEQSPRHAAAHSKEPGLTSHCAWQEA